METVIFFEDFDGSGPGFNESPLKAWSIGGPPILSGFWNLASHPGSSSPQNLTGGNGRYAYVHRPSSSEPIGTPAWMVSPLIDIVNYQNIQLKVNLYFKVRGYTGEETINISLLATDKVPFTDPIKFITIEEIGKDMDEHSSEIQGCRIWNLAEYTKQSRYIQLAFSWQSSIGPGNPNYLQLDNIRVSGEKAPFGAS